MAAIVALAVGGMLALSACAHLVPPTTTSSSLADAPVVASLSADVPDEPSPPGGLGNVVESFSRTYGRPTAAFGVNEPSYEYGAWPARGMYVILDDSFRRAREVRINFGASLSSADATARARGYLPPDARLIGSFVEASTGDAGETYRSQRLAAVFPSVSPPGAFVVVYDGTGDRVDGIILRMGPG